MAYAKRYAGGFADNAGGATPIDSTFLNAVETALLELLSADGSADGQVLQWINASSKFGPALLLNKNVDPTAAIDKSKLNLAGQIIDADISGSAAIARSKLSFGAGLVNADIAAAAAIATSKLAAPGDTTVALLGNFTTGRKISRITSPINVSATVADTDLLGGLLSVGAGLLGTTGTARLTAEGDWVQNSGASRDYPRFKVKLGAGATVIIDTGVSGGTPIIASATRFGWKIVVEITNQTATNVQWVSIDGKLGYSQGNTGGNNVFTTGEGITQTNIASTGSASGGYVTLLGGNAAAIDTTAAMPIVLSVINPSAAATLCETKLQRAMLEIL